MAYDENGNYLHFGKPLSPQLTDEQKTAVIGYLAESRPMREVAELVGCSFGRVRQVRADLKAAESIHRERSQRVIPEKIDRLVGLVNDLTTTVRDLVSQVSQMKIQQKAMNVALYRRQLELKSSREKERTVREERKRLRRELHRLTGDHGYKD